MSEGPCYDDIWSDLTPEERRDENVGCGCLFLAVIVGLVFFFWA